jgi:hypothetical protein
LQVKREGITTESPKKKGFKKISATLKYHSEDKKR